RVKHASLAWSELPRALLRVDDEAKALGDARDRARALRAQGPSERLRSAHVGMEERADRLILRALGMERGARVEVEREVQRRTAITKRPTSALEEASDRWLGEQIEHRIRDDEIPASLVHPSIRDEVADDRLVADALAAHTQPTRLDLHRGARAAERSAACRHAIEQRAVTIDEHPVLLVDGQSRGEIDEIGAGARTEIQDPQRGASRAVFSYP